jgi:hypothetical protein
MITVANAKKLQWLWRDENKVEWIQTFIKIADKQGNIVPFILTPEQKEFLTNLDNKDIVLKSRQLGLSVCVIAESIREVVTRENCTCALISHNQSSCNAVFDKLKQQFNSLPDWVKPETVQNNRQALTFKNGSSIVCLTAGNKDLLRGSTITGVCHCSEIAFWKDTERHMKALSQACSETSTLILESTANGFNRFSELYYQAKNGENDFKPFFFNWINGRTLFKGQYDLAVDKYKANHSGRMLTEAEYDEEEKQLAELGATPEQIVWRRGKISTEGIDTFHVEYPSTDDECFISTGCNVFDTNKIAKLLKTKFKEPLKEERLTSINNDLRVWVKNGSLKIYSLPRAGMRYWIGVDVSEGVGLDSSTMFVIDKNGDNVCTFKNNKIKPYEFADVCYWVGRLYGNAHLVVEKASGGHSVLERLRYTHKYRNLAKYKTYDEYNKIQWKWGFDTNAKTKGIAVNDAREWFDKGLIKINDKELLNEMKVFVINENGQMGAIDGAHDDLVSAMWLAIQGQKSGYWYL